MVARTARRHKLHSEARKRWERGVDPALPLVAARAGGAAARSSTAAAPPTARCSTSTTRGRREPIDASTPTCRPAWPGCRTRRRGWRPLLSEIGCAVTAGDGADQLVVTPPTWRPDLTDPADLVEEVIRLDGYDQVPERAAGRPARATASPPPSAAAARSAGRWPRPGYVEVLSYPFVGAGGARRARASPPTIRAGRAVRLRNPISEEEPALRTTLLPPLLATLRRNIGRGHRDVALYEIGLVFHPARAGGTGRRRMRRRRAGPPTPTWPSPRRFVPEPAVARRRGARRRRRAGRLVGRGPAGRLGRRGRGGPGRAGPPPASRSSRVTVRAAQQAPWHPGRCAEILVDGAESSGTRVSCTRPSARALDLPRRTCAMELTSTRCRCPG